MSNDTWSDIQAHKNKQLSLREKLIRRRKERQVQIETLTGSVGGNVSPTPSVQSQLSGSPTVVAGVVSSSSPSHTSAASAVLIKSEVNEVVAKTHASPVTSTSTHGGATGSPPEAPGQPTIHLPLEVLHQVERHLLVILSDITLILPMEVSIFMSQVRKQMNQMIPESVVEDLMSKFAAQLLITLDSQKDKASKNILIVDAVDHNKLSAVTAELEELCDAEENSKKRKKESDELEDEKPAKQSKKVENKDEDFIESLLSMDSAKQRESKKMSDEILQLLSKPTAKEQSLIEKFKSVGGAQVKEFCPNGTKEECVRVMLSNIPCGKLHFRKIIHKHTDENLGDCSFLNTCFHMDSCKYVHYEIDYPEQKPSPRTDMSLAKVKEGSTNLFPPQWIQCDVRKFDMSVLGKFAVIMADPPWDIHMELPYGTMGDDEMRQLQLPVMQDDGYIFLWVTGRAMELGRECLQLWGYERVDELIWVKTNQLQRIIRTGRTGHWLNHGKEHCLVGVKGNPKHMNRGLDCDVIVAEVRATSHKPDEIYGIIERLSPGSRKIELFGRPHNVQPNWVTLGNQLDGVKLSEPDVVKRYKDRYPNGYTL